MPRSLSAVVMSANTPAFQTHLRLLLRIGATAVVLMVGACSDPRTDKLVSLCTEDDRMSHAECECQSKVLRSTMSEDDIDMLLRMGSVKSAEERMSIMREAGRNEEQFRAWGKSFQSAVEKATRECQL